MASKKNNKPVPPARESLRTRVARELRARFALRMHTLVLLLWTFCAGLLTTKALYALGVQTMWLRYLLAILVGYGAFILGVRIWLAYIGYGRNASSSRNLSSKDSKGSSLDLPDLGSSGSGSGGSGGVFRGGGGGSGGAGSSGSFAMDGGMAPRLNLAAADSLTTSNAISEASSVAPGGDGGGGGGILSNATSSIGDAVGDIGGGDDGCLIAFAVMVVIGLIALAIGGAVFIISAGPEILIDAAFNAMLVGGLLKASNRVSEPDWMGSVLRATWKPFMVVLVMALAFAFTAAMLLPKAHTFGEVMKVLWPLLLDQF